MGILGELGPIDPQLGDMPALGVKRALETIASVSEQYPGSAEAFARYMSRKITIEQIGYCERVAESAVQYAERLLGKKESFRSRASKIAKQLVYGYKDHGFVIDTEEAKTFFGESFIVEESKELALLEQVYLLLDYVETGLNLVNDKQLSVVGDLRKNYLIYPKPE